VRRLAVAFHEFPRAGLGDLIHDPRTASVCPGLAQCNTAVLTDYAPTALLVESVSREEGAMTEQSVETTQVTLILPVLHPSQTPRDAVAHLAHMFNDLGEHPPFEEIGKYGPKTTAAVKRLQKDQGLEQTGSVGSGTWKALLEQWLPR
jgi:murein L,D-transpeptidase YcbB/YkuD